MLVATLALIHGGFAQAANNVCCERLTTGAWCQNAPASACATGVNPTTGQKYQQTQTSCLQTSFCQIGTCINTKQGTCTSQVSQAVCNADGGVWNSKQESQIPQCQLGCCLLSGGNSGAQFTTLVNCKQLSSKYSVKTNFNSQISSESQCVALAGGNEEGACVYVANGERTCKRLTKSECNSFGANGTLQSTQFYNGDLCSNENLSTNCGPSTQTTCVPGKQGVYFVDTCGNIANIYDASKKADNSTWTAYWQKIIPINESCNPGGNNTNSANCGNCNYYLGSTCTSYKAGSPVKPTLGGNYCQDLGCFYQGQYYQQGESWCGLSPATPTISDQNQNGSYTFSTDSNARTARTSTSSSPDLATQNLPGSSYTKLTCLDGKVNSYNCGAERQQVCVQDNVNGFLNAACELNKWQDCWQQTNETACMDRSVRDCQWEPGEIALGTQYYSNATKKQRAGACVPLNPAGFNTSLGSGDAVCSLGTIACPYVITQTLAQEVGVPGTKVQIGSACVNKDGTIKQSWINSMQTRCEQIADCGPKNNYKGIAGEIQKAYENIVAKK